MNSDSIPFSFSVNMFFLTNIYMENLKIAWLLGCGRGACDPFPVHGLLYSHHFSPFDFMDQPYCPFAYIKELIMIHPIRVLNGYISNSCFKTSAVLDGGGIGSLTLVFDSQIPQLKHP